jgi:Flp pilus assembly protein TadD
MERRPLVWNGWFILGWALRLLGRWSDGAAAFRKAIDLGGGNSDTRNELAICLMETGDIPGARRELEAALTEDPENVKIISNLGVLALKNGDREKAAAFFRTVLELDSDDPVAREFLDKN